MTVSRSAGAGSATIGVSVDTSAAGVGTSTATLTFEAPGAMGTPLRVIPVHRTIFPNTCRGLFFARQIVAADNACGAAVGDEARLFRSITRIYRAFDEQVDGPDPTRFTDSFKEMLDRFGVPAEGRSVFDFVAEFPEMLPYDAPWSGDVQEFLRGVVVGRLENSIEGDLRSISSGFSTVITTDELTALGMFDAAPVELDTGDVKLLEAGLSAIKGTLLTWLVAYDLDVNLYELQNGGRSGSRICSTSTPICGTGFRMPPSCWGMRRTPSTTPSTRTTPHPISSASWTIR